MTKAARSPVSLISMSTRSFSTAAMAVLASSCANQKGGRLSVSRYEQSVQKMAQNVLILR